MAMPALMFEPESDVEERVTRLEANFEHVSTNISEMKVDIRGLNDKVDALDNKLTAKIDAVDNKLTAKIEAVDKKLTDKIDAVETKLTTKIEAVDKKLTDKIDAVKDSVNSLALAMEKSFGSLRVGRAVDRVWWLLMSAALLGIMARAFKWL